jgi:hypothetical protein
VSDETAKLHAEFAEEFGEATPIARFHRFAVAIGDNGPEVYFGLQDAQGQTHYFHCHHQVIRSIALEFVGLANHVQRHGNDSNRDRPVTLPFQTVSTMTAIMGGQGQMVMSILPSRRQAA